MKLLNVRVHTPTGEIFWAKGAKLLDKSGNMIVPEIVVESITFLPIFKETSIRCSDGTTTVYRGFGVSYEYRSDWAWVGKLREWVKEKVIGKEGDMPPGRTGNE